MVKIRMVGYKDDKVSKETFSLIQYLVDLEDKGFSINEMLIILGKACGTILEGCELNEDQKKSFYEYIERVYQASKYNREKCKEI